MKRSILLALAIAAMAGCQKHNNTIDTGDSMAVSFSSSAIATRTVERTTNGTTSTLWNIGDEVGITAKELGYEHMLYLATKDGLTTTFSPAYPENPIYISSSIDDGADQEINYYAYYPTSARNKDVDKDNYILDLNYQEDNYMKFDFIFAHTAKTYGAGNPYDAKVEFDFEHVLAKLVLNVSYAKLPESEASGDDPTSTITEAIQVATYDIVNNQMKLESKLEENGKIFMCISDIDQANKSLTATALVHPVSYENSNISFKIDGKEYFAALSTSDVFEGGKVYTHAVTIGNDAIEFSGATISDWTAQEEDGESLDFDSNIEWDGTSKENFEGKDGATVVYSEDVDNYYIKTPAQLAYFAWLVNNRHEYMTEKTFTLVHDIDLGGKALMIGNNFNGTFDGNGYSISGLSGSEALFYHTSEIAVIKNLTVSGEFTRSGIVYYNGGLIKNCQFMGSIVGTGQYVGGIASSNQGTITNCACLSGSTISNSNTSENASTGGIVGWNNNLIENCYSDADITTENTYAGGITGYNWRFIYVIAPTIISCYNLGNITSSGKHCGGIVGKNEYSIVKACYNRGNIKGSNNIGGIVGKTTTGYSSSDSPITSCYNIGKVAVTDGTTGSYFIGEIVGYNEDFCTVGYVYSPIDSGIDILGNSADDESTSATTHRGYISDSENIKYDKTNGANINFVDELNAGAKGMWKADDAEEPTNLGYPVLVNNCFYIFTEDDDQANL